GHGVIVHPLFLDKLGWFKSSALARHAAKVIEVHGPDLVHVFSSEPYIVDAFVGRGVPVVHSTLDRAARADWVVAPSASALAGMGVQPGAGEMRSSVFPYPIVVEANPNNPGSYVLVHLDRADRQAKSWIAEAGAIHKDIPIRFDGSPAEARIVVS